jgi:hypothetical protein
MSNPTTDRPGSSGRHPVNIGHLVMGLAFAGLLGIWALIEGGAVDGGDIRWLLPLPWVFAGAVGLLAVSLANRRRTPWLADPSPTDTQTPDTQTTEDTDITEEIR